MGAGLATGTDPAIIWSIADDASKREMYFTLTHYRRLTGVSGVIKYNMEAGSCISALEVNC